jgi:hypothetical protein
VPAGILDPPALCSLHSPSVPIGLVLEPSANGEAVTQWILNRLVRGGNKAFKDRPIEVTGGDADPCEPVLSLAPIHRRMT